MKYSEWKDIFEYSWSQVACAFWKRYPNPESVHVLSEDTLSQEIIDGALHTKRLFTKTNVLPKWAERFTKMSDMMIMEESIIDPKDKTITTYTRNVVYSKYMNVVEKVVYSASDTSSGLTVAERSVWVECNKFGVKRAIEAFGIDRFRKNCAKTVKGFNYVLNNMFPKPAPITVGEDSGPFTPTVSGKEKLMGAAKKATHIAKSKAETIYATASCEPSQS